jgi:hypothetical protein
MSKRIPLSIASLVAAGATVLAAEQIDLSKIDTSKLPPASDRKGVTYGTDIKPLFEASCLRCHGQERPKGGLRLDSLSGVLKGGKDGAVVVAGDSKKSLLAIAAAQIDEHTAMPPKRGPGRGQRGPGGPGGAPGGPGGPPPGAQGGRGNPPPDGAPQPGGVGGGGQGRPGGFGPPPKPLTAEQVGLVRVWIDQGAK